MEAMLDRPTRANQPVPRATHTRGHVQRVAYTHREGAIEALEARVPRRGVIQAMGQLASEFAEDLFRRKRAIFHVFDWPAHEEADAKQGDLREWTFWNHVRSGAALVAAALLTFALIST
jgi:hypothetical protein